MPTLPPEGPTVLRPGDTDARGRDRSRLSDLLTAALVGCVSLGCAEFGARRLLDATRTASSYESSRNLHFRRGWPDFTRPQTRPPDESLVIVISNSQGFFRESEDGLLAWPKQLEELLDAYHPTTVLNWSIPGGRAPEFTVLAARAAQHNPALVIVSTFVDNYHPVTYDQRPLSFWISDVTDLAYLRDVRRMLPHGFLERSSAYDVGRWLTVHDGLVGLGHRFIEARNERWRWSVGGLPNPPTEGETVRLGRIDSVIARKLLAESATVIRRYSPETTLAFLHMPLPAGALDGESKSSADLFVRTSDKVSESTSMVETLDARSVVPDADFLQYTHMTASGHRALAEWLSPWARQVLQASRDEG